MTIFSSTAFRYLLLGCSILAGLTSCAYQRPSGHWISLETEVITFPAVELDEKDIDANYAAVCKEAQDEINTRLKRELPAKISPLKLLSGKTVAATDKKAATLKLRISRCEIDVDQSGGSFSYYLTLPVDVSLTQNGTSLLDYSMQTYEQITIDNPSPDFEFTFAEPVSRTLLLFNGGQLWIPHD